MRFRALLLFALASPMIAAPTRWAQQAQAAQESTKDVVWPSHEPLAFLLRRGGNAADVAEAYERQHDPENIRRMAAAGVTYGGMLHFYKGLGLAAERVEIEKTKAVGALMHQLGMKFSLYMAGTMFVDSFYNEVPEAKNWEQRDQLNRPVPYTQTQTYRHYPCSNEPAYRSYLERVLRIAVEEIHADHIMFDNVMLQPEPKACHCPRCRRAFVDFLRECYPTRETALRRFGLSAVDSIQPPEWDDPATPNNLRVIDDPVMQEWVRFRAESLAHHAAALYDYVKSLNPSVLVGFNIKGLYSFNRIWTNAVYHPLFVGHCDILTFDTGGYDSRLDAVSGALVSQIRSYKMSRRLGIAVVENMKDEIHAVVHAVFNDQTRLRGFGPRGAGFMFGANTLFTPTLEFLRDTNDRYFTGTENVADVAVFRNWPSMAYSLSANYVPATLLEQVLIQYHVPFDLLHEEQIDRLPRYRAVIVAGQDCLSDAQIETLTSYARGGGTLLVAADTGHFNERREARRLNPFLSARGEGKGRVVILPRIVPADAAAKSAGGDGDVEITGGVESRVRRFAPQEWVLPRDHAGIYGAVATAVSGGFSVQTDAPLTTVAEILNRPESSETLVHCINFDRRQPTAPISVTLRKQYGGGVRSVTCLSPDQDEATKIPFRETPDTVSFTVPATRLYAMAVVAHDGAPLKPAGR